MVVMRFPPTVETGVWHARCAFPSMCTVHAPHCPIPHPNLVPVSPITSRKTHNSGIDGSTSTDSSFPFTLNFIGIDLPYICRKSIQPRETLPNRTEIAANYAD